MKSLMRRGPAASALMALALAALIPAAAPLSAQPVAVGQLRSYADVADLTMPAVVNISTDKVVESGGLNHPFLDDPMLRRFFNMPDDDIHGGGNNNERVEHSLGSGVVISADGLIITNNHVVENASKIVVTFMGDIEYEAEVIGTDPPTDVALIKIDAGEELPFIRIGDSGKLRLGDQVMAIGNPFGVGQSISLGIVSALGRNIGLMDYADLIQTDAAINRGNSGGALVNMQGELVGINAAILSSSGGSQGIGFAIPTAMAMRVVDALRTVGEVQRAYLGVLPQAVDQSIADALKMDRPRGVLISQVNEDTPAARAGLQYGDVILTVDGKEIRNPSMLRNVISLSEVGHEAELEILRDGKPRTVMVRLDRLPDQQVAAGGGNRAEPDSDDSLEGVTVRAVDARLRAMANLPDDVDGIYVVSVSPTSNAAREGLAEGDVIQEIRGQKVASLADYQKALAGDKDRPVFMRVYKPQQRLSIFIAVPR